MLGQQIRFEWHIAEERSPWADLFDEGILTDIASTLSEAEVRLAVRLMCAMAVLMVGMVALSGAAQTPEERARILATAGIQAALAHEDSARPDSAESPDRKLLAVKVIDGVAMADMLVDEPAVMWRLSSPYHETRFYNETELGWQRVTPDPAFWGSKRYGETEHLRFEYYAHDAVTVAAIAPRLEQSYRTLYAMLGLDLPPSGERITVEVTPAAIRGRGIYEGRIETSSPLFAQIPDGMSDADYLAHRVINRLLYGIVNWNADEHESTYTSTYQWRTLQRGLRSWLQTELMGEPWPWDLEAENLLRQAIERRDTFHLSDVNDWDLGRPLSRERLMLQYAVAASVISFAVDTYGRERLVPLVEGLNTYGTWQDMIPAVFDVSDVDFERGWQRYLQEKYGPKAE